MEWLWALAGLGGVALGLFGLITYSIRTANFGEDGEHGIPNRDYGSTAENERHDCPAMIAESLARHDDNRFGAGISPVDDVVPTPDADVHTKDIDMRPALASSSSVHFGWPVTSPSSLFVDAADTPPDYSALLGDENEACCPFCDGDCDGDCDGENDDDLDDDADENAWKPDVVSLSSDLQTEIDPLRNGVVFDPLNFPEPLGKMVVRITHVSDGDSGHSDANPSSVRAEETGELTVLSVTSGSLHTGDHFKFRCIGPDAFETDQGQAGQFGTELAQALLLEHIVEMWVYGTDDYGRLLVAVFVDAQIWGETLRLDYASVIVRLGAAVRYNGSKYEKGAWYEYLDILEDFAKEEKRRAWGLEPLPRRPENHRRTKKRKGTPTEHSADRRYLKRMAEQNARRPESRLCGLGAGIGRRNIEPHLVHVPQDWPSEVAIPPGFGGIR